MRIGVVVVLTMFVASAGAACCVVDRNGDANWFFNDQHYFAKAKASSPYELVVTEVFRGEITVGAEIDLPRPSPVVVTSDDDCHPRPVAGRDYLVAGGSTEPKYTPWPPPPDFMKILTARHVITSADLRRQLRMWRERRLSTQEFREWLLTAETNTIAFRDPHSLLVLAISNAELLTRLTEAPARDAFIESLEKIVRRLPSADTRPPLEHDIGTARDRYNPAHDQLQDWRDSVRRQFAQISG